MKKQVFGYIRISTQDQNEQRQHIALSAHNIPKRNLYIDKQSGKDFNRPAYKRMIKRLKKGDTLYIKSIDRLGRNYAEIIEQWRVITREKGVNVKVLDMPLLDTSYCADLLGTFISDLVLQILSFTAQLERDFMLQRQAEGIAAAKARGVKFGNRPRPLPDNFDELYRKWQDGELKTTETAALCGISTRTLYERTRQRRATEKYVKHNVQEAAPIVHDQKLYDKV